jgi:hypothetical protein
MATDFTAMEFIAMFFFRLVEKSNRLQFLSLPSQSGGYMVTDLVVYIIAD